MVGVAWFENGGLFVGVAKFEGGGGNEHSEDVEGHDVWSPRGIGGGGGGSESIEVVLAPNAEETLLRFEGAKNSYEHSLSRFHYLRPTMPGSQRQILAPWKP